MKTKKEIIARYEEVKRDVKEYHTAKTLPRDKHGNVIGGYDNVFNEGMLKALEFVLDEE